MHFFRESAYEFFLSKIDKRLFDLTLPWIIVHYQCKAILTNVFAVIETCDWMLCQHDVRNVVLWMTDSKNLEGLSEL